MNKIIYCLLAIALFSCTKKRIQPTGCTFGLDTQFMNTTRRLYTPDEEISRRKPSGGLTTPAPTTTTATGTATLLLQFNGDSVKNTSWNYAGNLYLDSSGLTPMEQLTVLDEVYNHYRQFGFFVITTDTAVYNHANKYKRMKCIVTQSWEWYGRCGGVSFNNSLFWGSDTPCFVFSILLNYNIHNIGEAVAHEIGHTIGLNHKQDYDASCNMINPYTLGATMGNSYGVNIGAWTNGTTTSCTTYVNDSLFIASKK